MQIPTWNMQQVRIVAVLLTSVHQRLFLFLSLYYATTAILSATSRLHELAWLEPPAFLHSPCSCVGDGEICRPEPVALIVALNVRTHRYVHSTGTSSDGFPQCEALAVPVSLRTTPLLLFALTLRAQ